CTPPVSLSNVTATTVILTLSLHDALPICSASAPCCWPTGSACGRDAATPSTAGRLRGTELVLVDSHCHLDAAEFDDDRDRVIARSEEHTSELQSRENLVCRLLLEKKKRET